MPVLQEYKEKYVDIESGKIIPTIAIFDNIKIGYYDIHIINSADRIDIIAKQYYGDSSLWWIIALVNDLYDPILDFKPRKKIIIPRLK